MGKMGTKKSYGNKKAKGTERVGAPPKKKKGRKLRKPRVGGGKSKTSK